MTSEPNQKRLLFIEQIKKNYSAIYGYQLIFYFDDYDISKINAAEYHSVGEITGHYLISRRDQESGAVIVTHDFSNNVIIYLTDKYYTILYEAKTDCVTQNYAKVPFDLEQIIKEFGQLFLSLKSK